MELEKAAIEYAQDKYLPVQTARAFVDGGNWVLSQLWHDASEKPQRERFVVVLQSGKEPIRFWDIILSNYIIDKMDMHPDVIISKWAYLDDIVNTDK